MINFIRGVPKYAIGDQCTVCEVWYPKNILRFCPCCGAMVRHVRPSYARGEQHYREGNSDEVKERIEAAVKRGWTPINRDVMKALLDFRLLHGLPLK
jgi:hypothetical protein